MSRALLIFHMRNFASILMGTIAIAIGLRAFAMAAHLAEGGFTGLGLLIHYYRTDWNLSYILLILNVATLLISFRTLGKKSLIYSIWGIFCLWGSLELASIFIADDPFHIRTDPFLAALYAGVCIGIGCGIIFRVGGSTGGMDIIAQYLHRHKNISIGQTILCWDAFIVAISLFFLTPRLTMYTVVEIVIVARIIDFFMEGGMRRCRTATIISSSAPEIQKALSARMGRGATILQGKGAYTGDAKEVLYVVVSNRELPILKRIVMETDSRAFMVIHNARDVMGEGFSPRDISA